MRCFIAVDIDKYVREAIERLSGELRRKAGLKPGQAGWVDPKIIHLTLKFLGEVPDKDINDICRAVEEVAVRNSPFTLVAKGAGCFGRPSRVVWAGIEPSSELAGLHKQVESAMETLGFGPEGRAFAGHLTLCRIKNPQVSVKLEKLAEEYCDISLGSFEVDSVYVYKSQLTSAGPIYTVISKSLLKQ